MSQSRTGGSVAFSLTHLSFPGFVCLTAVAVSMLVGVGEDEPYFQWAGIPGGFDLGWNYGSKAPAI